MSDKKEEKGKEEGKEEKKGGGNKMLIIIIAVLVLVIVGGAGAFFALSGGKDKDKEGAEGEEGDGEDKEHGDKEHGEDKEHGDKEHAIPNAVLPLDTFIVNLQVKGSFLKTTIQLEFNKPELPHEMDAETAKIRDAIIRVMSNKNSQELLTLDGKQQLKDEIKKAANEAIESEDIVNIYMTEFIIQ